MDNLASRYIRKRMGWMIVLIRADDALLRPQNITQGSEVEVGGPLCGTSKASLQKYRVRVRGGADPKALQVAPHPGSIQAGKRQGTAATTQGKHAEHPRRISPAQTRYGLAYGGTPEEPAGVPERDQNNCPT